MSFALTILSYVAAFAAGVYAARSTRLADALRRTRVGGFVRQLWSRRPW